jgi:hypothetical protein
MRAEAQAVIAIRQLLLHHAARLRGMRRSECGARL